MHGIDDHLQAEALETVAQGLGVDLGFEAGQVGPHGVKAQGLPLDRHGDATRLQPPLDALGEVPFYRSPEGTFDLEAQPLRRVVARGDHQCAKGLPLHHGPARGRGGDGRFRQHRHQVGSADGAADRFGEFGREETAVVADHDFAAG